MSTIIGRKPELAILTEVNKSNKPELIAVFGRRRVGKTFLIREFYKKDLIFEVSGLYQGNLKEQLENFTKELQQRQGKIKLNKAKKWMDAFILLENYLSRLKSKKKKVIFIDEFPWMATNKSKFLTAFESFWNQYATKRNDLIVVICGSDASYMIKNIIKNKGGLHNRITRKIRLLPFNLQETELFLRKKNMQYTQYDILQLYMAIGGVPHYLDKLEKGFSVAQNLDRLCFDKDGILNDEFTILFTSLFDNAQKHEKLVKILATCKKGITRDELLRKSGIQSGGDFTLKLSELIESGFVSEYSYFQNKKKLTLYRLSDEYTLFYLKFIEDNKNGGLGTWQQLALSRSYSSWSGFSFETACLKHIRQIKQALRIDAIYATQQSWFNENAHIDLLIDRADNVINLCEIKFYNAPFTIDKSYYSDLKHKLMELQKDLPSKKNIFITMITTYGVKNNQYSNEIVSNNLKMNILFE